MWKSRLDFPEGWACDSIAFSSGIDLPETTDIILYHKMSNKNIEIQVLGRALRLGRKEPLYLHRLLTEEEDVLIHSNSEYVRN